MITLSGYRLDAFYQARVRLTVLYVLLSLFLLTIFSMAAMKAEEQALTRVQQAVSQPNQPFRTKVIEERLEIFDQQFKDRLILFDGLLLAVACLGSFWLSGVTLQPIHEMVKQQEDFAAEASHELRTPLSTISMEIEAFKRTQKANKSVLQMTNSIQEEVLRMKQMVDGLLILVRTNETSSQSNWKEMDLDEIVHESCVQIGSLAKSKQIKLKMSLVPVKLRGVRDQIKQIFLILLDNAVKYTPAKGQIQVDMKVNSRKVSVSITDTGIGIPKEDLPHIFERFYRSKVSGSHEGTGLGLAIAQRLVRAHLGTIKAVSSGQKGATFIVELPRV